MRRLIFGYIIGFATAIPTLALAQLLSGDLREPASPGILDRIAIIPVFSTVDAGYEGSVVRRRVDGLNMEAHATARAVNPDEPSKPILVEKSLAGACRTDMTAWIAACVMPDLKAAASLR